MRIEALDPNDSAVRERVFAYLGPHEPFGLFILGNLNARFPGTHLYAASRAGRWLGLAGYYEGPRSLTPFSLDSQAAGALAQRVLDAHGVPEWLLGAPAAAGPALGALSAHGCTVLNQPRHVFMEMPLGAHLSLPLCPLEAQARFLRPGDGEAVARLLRHLRDPNNHKPLTKREIKLAGSNALRLVLELDGRVVATAATNGLGIRAFLIIGVVTDPEYRRRGCARAVCAALIRHMHGLGGRHCVLFTDETNIAAQRCYQGMGFQTTGEFLVAKLGRPAQSNP